MPLARYWRLSRFFPSAKATQLELSEVILYDLTSSLMPGVTVTSNFAPDTGSLTALTDGSASATCSWVVSRFYDLTINFDFGAGVTPDVRSVAFGSGAVLDNFPLHATLEYSTDGVTWVVRNQFLRDVNRANMELKLRRLKWPGANSMQAKTDPANPDDLPNFIFQSAWPPAASYPLRLDWENGSLRYRKAGNMNAPSQTARELVNLLRTGKLYMEVNGSLPCIGLVDPVYPAGFINGAGYNYSVGTGKVDFSFAWEAVYFYKYSNISYLEDPSYRRPNSSKVVGICFDLDNKQMWAIIDGVEKTKYTIPNLTPEVGCFLAITNATNGALADYTINFGRQPFVNTMPAGFTTFDWYEIFSYETQKNAYEDSFMLDGNFSTSHAEMPPLYEDRSLVMPSLYVSHSKDAYKNGRGFIKSTVSIDTTPTTYIRRRVFIKEAFTGIHIDDQYSQPGTGVFEFKFLDLNKQYIVYSIDDVTGLATTISGPIYPTKMPIFTAGPYA